MTRFGIILSGLKTLLETGRPMAIFTDRAAAEASWPRTRSC
jgi:hypothetical protein